MIITRTPYRISLFGGGSDHPLWFRKNGGRVISFAINKYCYITTRILPPFFEHRYRVAYSKVEAVKHFSAIQHPAVRESIRKYAPDLNLEIHHDGDLPARSGIGSSSAFAVGIINAISALKGQDFTSYDLANLAIELEYEILKEKVGWQDQIACSFGGFNHIKFGPGNDWTLEPLNMDKQRRIELLSRLVLVFTGVSRNSTDITMGLLEDFENKASLINNLIDLASSCQSILTSSQDLDLIGELLDESWKLKKSMNRLASNNYIEEWYERGIKAGAIGGKVLGAGGGGFILYWIPDGKREQFLLNLGKATVVPFNICDTGSEIIYRDFLNEIG